jgi:hypothetical protein
MKGNKLSDSELATVADRLTDYVANCTPDTSMRRSEKLSFANVTVGGSPACFMEHAACGIACMHHMSAYRKCPTLVWTAAE